MPEATPAQELHEVTPERIRVLAARAESLAAAIRAAKEDFRMHPDEAVRRAGYRLDDVMGRSRSVTADLAATADDLTRLAARPEGSCAMPWGVCPDHGNTLASSGGRTWCQLPDCGRRWDYDRMGMPCEEPARWRLRDSAGDGAEVCDGHAADARERLEGAVLEPLRVRGVR